MKHMNLFFVVLSLGIISVDVHAASWCATNQPNAVFCDDFDRYCVNPPALPESCADGSAIDGDAFYDVWSLTDQGCNPIRIDDAFYTSPYWGGKTSCQEKSVMGINGVNLTPYCRAKYGPEYGSVRATDATPMTVEFVLDGQSNNKLRYGNTYLELAAGSMHSLNDHTLSSWCSACGGETTRYAIICRQDPTPAGCAPVSQAPVLASIAVGAVAYLDSDPCHCDGSYHSPVNNHLSFFNGRQWYILKQGLFPGGGTGGNPVGDFQLHSRQHYIRLTIKASTAKVEMTSTYPTPDEYSWCEIPLEYSGPFNTVWAGIAPPCHLKLNSWECRDINICLEAVPNGGVPSYDNISISGGMAFAPEGACCMPDTTCVPAFGGIHCESLGGTFQGSGTDCETAVCCPPFLPDHDMDSDVDLADFGWFQTCLAGPEAPPPSVPCRCADFQSDGFVDAIDLGTFLGCMLGPEIPTNPNCTD